MDDVERVRVLLDPHDDLPLECDGLTRVAHYELQRAKIPHLTWSGPVAFTSRVGDATVVECVPVHWWITLNGTGHVVDYRLRMWFGGDAPHGVFPPGDHPVVYDGVPVNVNVPDVIYDLLIRRNWA